MSITVTSNADTLRRSFERLERELPVEVADKAARKVALDVVADIQRGLSGNVAGVPKRVDTGRLRGAYGAGAAKVGLNPDSIGAAGDGIGLETRSRAGRIGLTIGANLNYATYIEEGTSGSEGRQGIEPGNHVARALGKAAQGLPLQELSDELEAEIQRAWEGA